MPKLYLQRFKVHKRRISKMREALMCSHCGEINFTGEKSWPMCHACGHRADRPRYLCNCERCKNMRAKALMCSHCGEINFTGEKSWPMCHACGHRADRPRYLCNCERCKNMRANLDKKK